LMNTVAHCGNGLLGALALQQADFLAQ
jgi:hypothetical protein